MQHGKGEAPPARGLSARWRPILFSAPMVRAILDGRKTQTRRVCRPQWPPQLTTSGVWGHGVAMSGNILGVRSDAFHVHTRLSDGRDAYVYCPQGKPGDRLWVRETWRTEELEAPEGEHSAGTDGVRFRADDAFQVIENTMEASERWVVAHNADGGRRPSAGPWRPSIFMPRWASRIALEVTEVRVQRLQDISEEDIRAEGVDLDVHPDTPPPGPSPHFRWRLLWDSINGRRGGASWAANPWIWAITFKRVESARSAA